MKIIDSHAHIGKIGCYSSDAAMLQKAMDSFDVQTAIISNMSANEFDCDGNDISNYKNQIEMNREISAVCRLNQEKFKGLFWIRPHHEKCNLEAEAFLKENKDIFVGLKVHPKGANLKFTYENYHDYLNLCKNLNLPFCIHTEQDGFSNIDYVYEVACECPDINFIAVHMNLGSDHNEAFEYIKSLPNLYGDTTLVGLQDVIFALQYCGSEKILFGSDAAIFGENSYERYRNYIERLPVLFALNDIDNLFWKNSERLFNL